MLVIENLKTALIGPVSLTVGPGECVAVQGASGSGKSLLLRAITDLDPNTGRVRLGDADRAALSAPDWRSRVMLVPAESGWWSDRVADHFPAGVDAAPLCRALGLEDALGWAVPRLSTGERQRLAIARALVRQPQALLLDEPTAALDATATEHVEALIRDRCKAGCPVILVTHDPAQADRLADRKFRMESGQLHREVEPA